MKLAIILTTLCCSTAFAQNRPIPVQNTAIYLRANAAPVEVYERDVERYRCETGRLVATLVSGGRTSAKRIELRCVT